MTQSTIFQSWPDGPSSTMQRIKCFAQGQKAVPLVRLEPRSPLISSQALYHWATALLDHIRAHALNSTHWDLFRVVFKFLVSPIENSALKTVQILSADFFRSQLIWIYTVYKRVDIWLHTVFESVICLSTERYIYRLICSFRRVKNFWTSISTAICSSLDK